MDARVVPAGDAAWLVELPERIDPVVNARAIDIASRVTRARLPFVRDVVVGYRSVMVYVDPMADGAGTIESRLRSILGEPAGDTCARGASVEVPVCYDGVFGLDLADVAAYASDLPGCLKPMESDREEGECRDVRREGRPSLAQDVTSIGCRCPSLRTADKPRAGQRWRLSGERRRFLRRL